MISAALAVLEDEGQREELSEFYEKYKSRFYAIAFEHVHNQEEAEDAVQDAFSAIADKPEIFFTKNENDRLMYTAVIVRNISVDYYKYDQKHITEELTDDIVDKKVAVMEQTIGECTKDELMEYIESLSEPLRQALLLRIHYQMNTSQIASTLNISETAARKRISDAGKKIKKFMEEQNNV